MKHASSSLSAGCGHGGVNKVKAAARQLAWGWRPCMCLPVGTSNSPVLCRGRPLVIRALDGYLTRRAAWLARLQPMEEAAVDACSAACWHMLARMGTTGATGMAAGGGWCHLRSSHFTPPACSPTGLASSQSACDQEHTPGRFCCRCCRPSRQAGLLPCPSSGTCCPCGQRDRLQRNRRRRRGRGRRRTRVAAAGCARRSSCLRGREGGVSGGGSWPQPSEALERPRGSDLPLRWFSRRPGRRSCRPGATRRRSGATHRATALDPCLHYACCVVGDQVQRRVSGPQAGPCRRRRIAGGATPAVSSCRTPTA